MTSKYYEENREYVKKKSKSYYYRNRKKIRAKQNIANKDPERQKVARDYQLKKKFGISLEDYNLLLERQGGVCAICGSKDSGRKDHLVFSVDHDHNKMIVRGLLCRGCNTGIGNLKENVEILLRAVNYLKTHSEDQCSS